MYKNKASIPKRQVFNCYSAYFADRLYGFLRSLLVELDANLDRRLSKPSWLSSWYSSFIATAIKVCS